MKHLLVSILIGGLLIVSCTKTSFITDKDASVGISSDTLQFDTVFTTVGSVTQFLLIHNDNNQKLRINNVSVGGGTGSFFKINVDGTPGPQVNDIEIDANDSIFVFVSVKVDPTATNLPFVIRDSLRVAYNGNERWVQLEAWGQNANFLRSALIAGNETWTNTKPYVILGGIRIDTTATLTIEKGCRIYMHADAPFIVDGTLKVNGEKYDSTRVVFRGDRLDEPYRDFPAGWPGIYFRGESQDNLLQFAVIKNAYQGIVADQPSVNANPKVTLSECIIDNCYDVGVFGLRSNIKAQNCLISNCGKNVVLAFGGDYDFAHCTVASYSNSFILHKEPVLLLTNFVKQDNNILISGLIANFRNCIFWGENGSTENEVVTSKQGAGVFMVDFQNCLWKVKENPANITSANIIANQSPLFDSINIEKRYYDFHLRTGSPAINSGVVTTIPFDLDGQFRNVIAPDLGCYEKQL